MLNAVTENKTKCHDLQASFQTKDEDISKMCTFDFHNNIYYDEASN